MTNEYKSESTFNSRNWDGNLKEIGTIKVQESEWKIAVKKSNIGGIWYLTYCLTLPKSKNEKMIYKEFNVNFTLVDQSANNIHFPTNLNFSNQSENELKEVTFFGTTWDKIYSETYVGPNGTNIYRYNKGGNSIIIQTEVAVTSHTFSNNIPGVTDLTLKVEDNKFYVSKKELCMNSEYFYELFVVQKCEDKVIEINDVSFDELAMFLIVLDPKNMLVSEKILNSLKSGDFEKYLILADRFEAKIIHSKIAFAMCLMFEIQPKSTTAFDYSTIRLKCLKFADKYNYINILDHCLNSF
ncbi:unnamed protein product [Caenorhabditis angaria]|uniref:BTB domain-containing protein n=1 Tax=Caenorhabditis angaria TaxID=860376 RepID=A0A9P1I8L7_9PELO|nr:unnamed protein product [Caenorhabditis angaria]